VELAASAQPVPTVAGVLTAQVLPTGAIVFKGTSGHGYPLVCASYMMSGNQVPFYAGRRTPGATLQHATLQFRAAAVGSPQPAIAGTVTWAAGVNRRIPTPFVADYAMVGARYTPVREGAALLNSANLTLSLQIPSYAAAGLATPFEITRGFVGNVLPQATGNIAGIRVNFKTGMFITRVQGRVTRPIFGVIIQGAGIDRGLGSVVDFTGLGTCELRPAVEAPANVPSN
jgi:hypothetical protein